MVAKDFTPRRLEPGDIREKNIQEQLDYAAEHHLTPLLSREGLAGGSAWRKRRQARLFKKHFGDCKIVLFVREPVSFCKSWYAQKLKSFHIKDPNNQKEWTRRIKQPPRYFDINEWMQVAWARRNSPQKLISCADTAAIYADVFGKENVYIFIFEEFVRNPDVFVTRLCNTIGIDAEEGVRLIKGKRSNDRITTGYIRRLREIEQSEALTKAFREGRNKQRRQMLDPENLPGDKFEPELSDKWIKKINAIGDKQNRRLVKEWGLPLADYGYRT